MLTSLVTAMISVPFGGFTYLRSHVSRHGMSGLSAWWVYLVLTAFPLLYGVAIVQSNAVRVAGDHGLGLAVVFAFGFVIAVLANLLFVVTTVPSKSKKRPS